VRDYVADQDRSNRELTSVGVAEFVFNHVAISENGNRPIPVSIQALRNDKAFDAIPVVKALEIGESPVPVSVALVHTNCSRNRGGADFPVNNNPNSTGPGQTLVFERGSGLNGILIEKLDPVPANFGFERTVVHVGCGADDSLNRVSSRDRATDRSLTGHQKQGRRRHA
jgi:hypothetical protein